MLYNSKLSRRYSKLKHGICDVYKIILELDKKTGLRASDCDIIIDKHSKILGGFHHYYSKFKLDKFGEDIRTIFEDKLGKVKTVYLPSNVDEWEFIFKEEVLEWDYEMLREIVIHEYAHYVETTIPECLDINYETHGTTFIEIVRNLDGKFINSDINDCLSPKERNSIHQWKYDYKRKVNPNILTLNICEDEEVVEIVQLGFPYDSKSFKRMKSLFNKYSVEGEELDEETLASNTHAELFISSNDFYETSEVVEAYHKNHKYWLL